MDTIDTSDTSSIDDNDYHQTTPSKKSRRRASNKTVNKLIFISVILAIVYIFHNYWDTINNFLHMQPNIIRYCVVGIVIISILFPPLL